MKGSKPAARVNSNTTSRFETAICCSPSNGLAALLQALNGVSPFVEKSFIVDGFPGAKLGRIEGDPVLLIQFERGREDRYAQWNGAGGLIEGRIPGQPMVCVQSTIAARSAGS